MAITLVGTPQVGNTNNGGDVTLTFDGTPAQDDVVVLFGGNGNNNGADDIGPTTSGYTTQATNLGSQPRFGVWTKRLGATPDASVTADGGSAPQNGVAYGCYVLRGVDTTTVMDVAPTTTGPVTDGSDYDAPAITTVTDGAWVLALLGASGASAASGALAGYSNHIEDEGVDTVRYRTAGDTREIASAGTEDPPAGAGSAEQWFTITVAIRPASAGITQPVGQATETDTAQPVTSAKTAQLGQPSETDTAQPVTSAKVKTLDLSTEADTAQSITALKTYPVGLAAEVDLAQAVQLAVGTPVGQAVETDQAFAITALKTVTLGLVVETDLALAVTGADIPDPNPFRLSFTEPAGISHRESFAITFQEPAA